MNRHPGLETFLEKIHLPKFMYQEDHPPAIKTRRVSRHEQQFLAAITMDHVARDETIGEFYPRESTVPPSPEDVARRFLEAQHNSPEDQN